MKILEILLLLLDLVLMIRLAWQRPSHGYLRWLTFLILLLGILLEAQRWQLYPAYVLTLILLIAGTRQQIKTKIFRYTVLTFLAFSWLVCAVLPVLMPVFQFPKPTGPYRIGTITNHWTDTTRREVFERTGKRKRELMVQLWYPGMDSAVGRTTVYLPDAVRFSKAFGTLQGRFPFFMLNHLQYVRTHAQESAPVASGRNAYPVLIFLEGLTGYRQMNTFQVEELVSHGYMVVAIDQPGVASTVVFPDGHEVRGPGRALDDRHLPYLVQDVHFVLDKLQQLQASAPANLLYRKMELDRIGIFGVSYGGIVAAKAALHDPRIKACLVMESPMTNDVVSEGLPQPAMWLTRNAASMRLERRNSGGWKEADILKHQRSMHGAYQQAKAAAFFVELPNMYHIDFTDLNALSPVLPEFGLSGAAGLKVAHDRINDFSLAFFNRFLKGSPQPLLLMGSAKPKGFQAYSR